MEDTQGAGTLEGNEMSNQGVDGRSGIYWVVGGGETGSLLI